MLDHEEEYAAMASAETAHWWYRSLHQLTVSAIEAYVPERGSPILDVGCGTGGLLLALGERGYSSIHGCDVSGYALQVALSRGFHVRTCDIRDVDHVYETCSHRALVCNDVLCYLEQKEMRTTLEGMSNVLERDGLLVLNVPALAAFSGAHDIRVGIRHRFEMKELRLLLSRSGFDIRRIMYWPFLLSPLIFLVRARQRVQLKRKPGSPLRSDVGPVPPLLNRILLTLTLWENASLSWKPFGSSLFVVARKNR